MNAYAKVVVGGAGGLILFDGAAAIASQLLHFPYTRASIGSFLICTLVGFLVGKGAVGRHALRIIQIGAILGFADATLGWIVAVALGASTLQYHVTPIMWSAVFLGVMVTYTMFTALGYGIAVLTRRNRARKT